MDWTQKNHSQSISILYKPILESSRSLDQDYWDNQCLSILFCILLCIFNRLIYVVATQLNPMFKIIIVHCNKTASHMHINLNIKHTWIVTHWHLQFHFNPQNRQIFARLCDKCSITLFQKGWRATLLYSGDVYYKIICIIACKVRCKDIGYYSKSNPKNGWDNSGIGAYSIAMRYERFCRVQFTSPVYESSPHFTLGHSIHSSTSICQCIDIHFVVLICTLNH